MTVIIMLLQQLTLIMHSIPDVTICQLLKNVARLQHEVMQLVLIVFDRYAPEPGACVVLQWLWL